MASARRITVGLLIQAARFAQGFERDELAKKLGISEGYLAHLEKDHKVPLSDVLYLDLHRLTGIMIPKKMRDEHNERSRKYYANYRKKKALEL